MTLVYIALGSNVGDRLSYLRASKEALGRDMEITAVSPVYDTEAVDTTEGGRFLNAAVAVHTERTPEEVLSLCLTIEKENGRMRSALNAPRTLDLDVLLYGDDSIATTNLSLPHPRMHERAFVLAPLVDIDPDLVHPTHGLLMRDLLKRCDYTDESMHRTDMQL